MQNKKALNRSNSRRDNFIHKKAESSLNLFQKKIEKLKSKNNKESLQLKNKFESQKTVSKKLMSKVSCVHSKWAQANHKYQTTFAILNDEIIEVSENAEAN